MLKYLRARTSLRSRSWLTVAAVIMSLSAGLYFSRVVSANNITWDGGGATNNWSEAANWSGNTVPGAGDIAVFDGTSTKDATIDAGFAGSVAGLQINPGYTGTITHASGATLMVGGSGFVQSVGSFTGGINNINCNSTFSLNGGTFTAPSGTLTLSSNVIIAAGATFNPNGGTVAFAGNSGASLFLPASLTLNSVTFNKADGVVVSFSSDSTLVATGTLTLTDGKINVNNGSTIDARGAVSIAATFDGGDVTLLISGPAARTVTLPAGATLPALTVNAPNVTLNTSGGPGTVTFNRAVDLVSAASFTNGAVNLLFNSSSAVVFESVNFTLGSGDFTCDNTFTQTGGTFIQGSGALNFNSTFSLNGGTFNAPSGTLTFSRNVTIGAAATFNSNGGTVAFAGNSGTSLFLPASLTLNNVTFNKADGVVVSFSSDSTLVATGTLTLTDGKINVNNGSTIDARGAVSIAATFDGSATNLSFSGPANQTFTNSGGVNPAGTWTINKPSGKVTLASNLILNSGQPLNITSGTLDQGASFNLQTSNTLNISGGGTLRDFGTGDLTLGGSLINNGILNFNGGGTACGDPNVVDQILIRSMAAGTTRAWSGGGAFSVVDVDVQDQDSSAIAGGITAFGSSVVNNSPGWTTNSGCQIAVTTQPSSVRACPGSPVNFTVAVSGTGPTVQWRKNGTPLSNAGNISGATSATLTINPVSAADVASSPGYDAIGTNSFGVTATTAAATLSLKSAPTITASPTGTTVCAGQLASFSANATGDGLTFQWRRNGTPLLNGGPISGADTPTLTINPTVAGDDANYDVLVSGDCTPPAVSSAAHLSVNTAPAISSQPANQSVCENGSASFSVSTTGTNLNFHWRKNGVPLADGGNISGATTQTLTINPATAADGGANLYDVAITGTCAPPATSNSATLTVNGFALSANSQNFTFAGGSGSVQVITGGACSWTAISNDSFIHITGGSAGTGNGTVAFNVDAGGPRTGTMTIAGQTFTVNENNPTATTGTIEGRIVDDLGQPVSGVVIQLSGTQNRKAITDGSGAYQFGNVETTGFYVARPVRVNYSFSPAERSFSQVGQTTDALFTAASTGEGANPIDTPEYFVRQQYLDLLGREPDEGGLNYWSDQLLACRETNCIRSQRLSVAAAFFIEPEAQQTGSYIYDMYAGLLHRKPSFAEYSLDRQHVVGGATLEAQKTAFAKNFVQRTEFAVRYQAQTTAESFVDALLDYVQSAGVDLATARPTLISAYNAGANLDESRALVVRAIADDAAFKQTQYNAAFVLTEYFGYLRRDAETDGFNFWLKVLNHGDRQNYRGMVCSFITATEYQERFGSMISHNNGECGAGD